MSHDPDDALRAALDELDDVLGDNAPDVHDTLQPGLAAATVDALSAGLDPLVLPRDLRLLYGWHNGQYPHSPGPHTPLFHHADFLPLERAIESYALWRRVLSNWCPLWFPAFGSRSGLLVVLDQHTDDTDGRLWEFTGEDTHISTAHDSILALVHAATDTWRTADLVDRDFMGIDDSVRREHSPASVRPNGRPQVILSMFETDDWPADWVAASTPPSDCLP